MPRLTTHRYLQIHYELQQLWLSHPDEFSVLSSRDQQVLHRYFQITCDASDDHLAQIRAELTTLEPNLPHQAGRAFKRLKAVHLQPHPLAPTKGTRVRGERIISVRSVVRPVPDMRKLARTFQYFINDEQGSVVKNDVADDHS